MRKDKVFHVISNTHWDREWRFPFQRNRQMLVNMIDKVLEILETEPDYRAFHLDSQSIVINDYLEIRPNKKETIKKFVEGKRLFIGPWYILPEEFQIGGENLIRNLLLGHKTCAEFGGASKVGYSPFSWGQISQLPQIYSGFGIKLIMFYRGVNSIDSPKAEFLWEGSDGTKSITSRFSTMPRYNFYFYIYRPAVHKEGFYDVEYKWERGGVPFHFADKYMSKEDYFIIDPKDEYYKENIKSSVEAIVKDQADDFTTPHVIWMEGHDSSGPNVKTVNILKDIKKEFPELNVKHSTLEDYSKLIEESADKKSLKLVTGERRSAQYDRRSGNMYGYTTSARMYLKQKNFDAERWLQFYAETFNSLAGIIGLNINDRYLGIAWNYLIQNSAHDSIGGCSLDEIHEDMMFRYKQAIEISKGVFERACKFISLNIDHSSFKTEGKEEYQIFLAALNPNNYLRNEVVEASVDVPQDLDKGSIKIFDSEGNDIPVQIKSINHEEPVLEQMIDRPMFFKMKRYECLLQLKDVAPFGIKSYEVKPAKNISKNNEKNIAQTSKGFPHLSNRFLTITFNKNGTFNITDKANNKSFNKLGYFYDEGESGHAWVHSAAKPFITTLKEKAKIKLIENGILSATVLVKHKLVVPATLEERMKKKGKTVKIPIQLYITLRKDSGKVGLEIKLENKAESHRLRFMFPLKLNAKYSYGEGQFDVVERTTERINSKDWIEQPMYDFPMHNFVDVNDGINGAAVLVDGLKEYEVLNDANQTLAVTLLRTFKFIIQPSSVEDYSYQKGSQCLGEQNYRLAFYPHSGSWQEGKVYKEAINFNNEISLIQTGKTGGTFSPSHSFLEIQPEELIFSCLKKAENGEENCFVLRFYNPTIEDIKGRIIFFKKIKKAEIVTLEEITVSKISIKDKKEIAVDAPYKKIVSVKVWF